MVLAAGLQNLIGLASPPGSPSATRVAWHFTSDLRQRLGFARAEQRVLVQQDLATAKRAADAQVRDDLVAQGFVPGITTSASPTLETLGEHVQERDRLAGLVDDFNARTSSTNSELEALLPALNQRNLMTTIVAQLNPNSVTFKQAKRIATKTTRRGRVFFHFTNNKGQNDDVLIISCKGSTGSLDRRASIVDAGGAGRGFGAPADQASHAQADAAAFRRLITFQNLNLLSHEPVLLPDNTRNQVYITMSSIVFPTPITLAGHFNAALDIEITGRDPLRGMYSFEFTVKQDGMSPSWDKLLDVIAEAVTSLSFSAQGVARDARIATETP